jgi:hypothetical protein
VSGPPDDAGAAAPAAADDAPRYPSGTVRALLDSELVTAPTRAALLPRLVPPGVDEPRPRFLPAPLYAVLEAVCARLLPQPDREPPIDLAAAIDRRLAEGRSDGWRYAEQPPDPIAYRRGLRALDEEARSRTDRGFAELSGAAQDGLLRGVQGGSVRAELWRGVAPQRFFEDLLAEAVERYYAHPLAAEEIGFAGMADARGWRRIGIGEREPHEPEPIQ